MLLKNRNVFGSLVLWVKPSSRRNIQLPGSDFVTCISLPDVMYQAWDVPSLDFFGFFVKIFCNFMFLIGLNFFEGFFGQIWAFLWRRIFWGIWRVLSFSRKKGKRFMSYDVFRHFHTYFNNIEINLINGIVFRQAVFWSFIYF